MARLGRQSNLGHALNLLGHHVNDALFVLEPPGDDEGRLKIDDQPAGFKEVRSNDRVRMAGFIFEGT